MTGQVQGKVALVTGGASGIGAAVAELLAREGASVAVTDIDELRGSEQVAGIKKAGHQAIFLQQDVTSEARWVEVVAEVLKRYGRLDVLVANAGIAIGVPSITEMTLEDWRRQTGINLDGVFLSVKHCLPAMRKTGMQNNSSGSIIMMSSLAGLRGAAGLAGYCATKGGVRLFAKAVAMECASAGDGIRVNSVHPGIIDTPIWGKIPTEATGSKTNAPIDPEERAKFATPLARGRGRRNCQWRVVPGLRCIALRHRHRTRDRRRHARRQRRAQGVKGFSRYGFATPFVIPGRAKREL